MRALLGAAQAGFFPGIIGLRGWQWLFLVESLPPIILGFVILLT